MAESNKKIKHKRDFEHMNDEQILNTVLEDFQVSQNFLTPIFDKFRKFYAMYRGVKEGKAVEGRSNLFIPYTFNLIETIVPKIINSIFATRPFFQALPLGVPDVETREIRAKKMSKFFDYQFQQKIKIVPILTDVIKTALIYGKAITKQTWNYKTKERVQKRQKNILGIPIPLHENVLVEQVINDEPMIENVVITDFFIDPAGTSIKNMRYCIHRYYEDIHELREKEKKGVYKNIDKVTEENYANAYDTLLQIGFSDSPQRRKGVEILEYWTDDWVVRVANRAVVVSSQPNPYFHREKPFSEWTYTKVPNEFYGIGVPEAIQDLQEELNTTRNQRIDNVSFVLNKMFTIIRGANVDPAQLVSRPAGFILVDSHDDIEELKFQDVTNSAYNEEAIIKQDMDTTTGVFDSVRGSNPDRRETATTMSILNSSGTERFKLANILIEYEGLQDMLNQVLRLNQQFIDADMEVQILGESGGIEDIQVTQEEILGEYDIIALGSSVEPVINKEVKQNQLIQLLNVVQNSPHVNMTEFYRRLFEAFDMKNIDALVIEQQPMGEQIPPEMMEALAQEQIGEVQYGQEYY